LMRRAQVRAWSTRLIANNQRVQDVNLETRMKLNAGRRLGSFSRWREKAGMRVPRAAPTLTPALPRNLNEDAGC